MDEMIDILNEFGVPTGATKSRADVHKDGDWHKVVQLFILDGDRILLQQRSKKKKADPLKWCASASGHISAGNDGQTTMAKELKEELGIELDKAFVRYVSTFKSPSICFNNGNKIINNHFVELYVSNQTVDLSEVIVEENEVERVAFFKVDEFRKMVLEKNEMLTDTPILFDNLLRYIDSLSR